VQQYKAVCAAAENYAKVRTAAVTRDALMLDAALSLVSSLGTNAEEDSATLHAAMSSCIGA